MSTELGIYIMSYNRPHDCITHNCLDYYKYVVREEQAVEYSKKVDNIIIIPTGAKLKNGNKVNDFMSTLYWIIENSEEEVIFIADDDIKCFGYLCQNITLITKETFGDNWKDVGMNEIVRMAQMLVDLNLGYAFEGSVHQPYTYSQEFSFKGMAGAMRWINKPAFKAKFNAEDTASGDIDIMLQELLFNRIILKPHYFFAESPTSRTNSGGITEGNNIYYDRKLSLKRKWGKYFDFNFKRNIIKLNVQR